MPIGPRMRRNAASAPASVPDAHIHWDSSVYTSMESPDDPNARFHVIQVPITRIVRWERGQSIHQVRKYESDMAQGRSIACPLVTPLPDGKDFHLEDGHHRLRAAKNRGAKVVTAVVDVLSKDMANFPQVEKYLVKYSSIKTASSASVPTLDQFLSEIDVFKHNPEHGAQYMFETVWGHEHNDGRLEFLGDPPFDPHRNEEAAGEWYQERYISNWLPATFAKIHDELARLQFPLTVYRAISLPGGIEKLNAKKIGIYWASSLAGADAYERDYESSRDDTFILRTAVPDSAVDWQATISARLDPYYGKDEHEITLKRGFQFGAIEYRDMYSEEWKPMQVKVKAAAAVEAPPLPVTETLAFKAWFGNSVVKDAEGNPLVVYRGEHGNSGEEFHTRLPSLSFGGAETASMYAEDPNNRNDKPLNPRVYPCYLRIVKPIINEPDDPFIDFTVLIPAIGEEATRRFALKHAHHIVDTNNWHEIEEEYGRQRSVEEFLAQHPEALGKLYMLVFPLLDDPEFVEALKDKGFDGAVHGGSGASNNEAEYRIFDASQAKSAIGNSGQFDPNNKSITAAHTYMDDDSCYEDENSDILDYGSLGEPIHETLYHGTDARITEFKLGTDGLIWFSNDPVWAKQWGKNVVQAEVMIQRPFVEEGAGYHPEWINCRRDIARVGEKHDGIVFRNPGDDLVTYAVFSPSQTVIKPTASKAKNKKITAAAVPQRRCKSCGSFVLDNRAGSDFCSDKCMTKPHVAATDSAAFQSWFNGSKIVDAEGQPLRVYHGTNQSFDKFNEERRGGSTGNTPATLGFWFTDHPGVASEYADMAGRRVVHNVDPHERETQRLLKEIAKAERRGDWDTQEKLTIQLENHELEAIRDEPKGMNVMPVYLRITNPKTIEVNGSLLNLSASVSDVIHKAKAEGHDGIVFKDVDDSPDSHTLCDHFVVFSANQIKSAIGNSGAFSRSPNITAKLLMRRSA